MAFIELACDKLVRAVVLLALKSTIRKTKHGFRSVTEILNLKTDHHLKSGCIGQLSDQEICDYNGSTRRDVASSLTGALMNTAASSAHPVFIPAAVLNLIQLTVSSINRRRVRREIKKRLEHKPGFREFYNKRNHPSRDIVEACIRKAGLWFLGAGIVGMDNIISAFANMAAHHLHEAYQLLSPPSHLVKGFGVRHALEGGLSHPIHSIASEAVHYHETLGATAIGAEPLSWHEGFSQAHPAISKADAALHDLDAKIGDEFAIGMSKATGLDISDSTSWADVIQLLSEHGHIDHEGVVAAIQISLDGAVSEGTQFPIILLDHFAEEYCKERDRI